MSKPFSGDMEGKMSAAFNRKPIDPASPADSQAKPTDGRKGLSGACQIDIDRIIADPDQPRTEFDPEDLQLLADSIMSRGQLQPARVRWSEANGKYVIVLGERRWRAAKLAGLTSLAVVVGREDVSAEDRLEDQIVENMLRSDLRPVEQARSFQRLIQAKGYTHADLADRLKIKRESVTQALRLLELTPDVQKQVDSGAINQSAAYEVAKNPDPVEQAALAAEIVDSKLSVADVRDRVSQSLKVKSRGASGKGKPKAKPKGPALHTELKHKAANDIRIIGTRRKGFDLLAWLEALEDAAASVRMKLKAEQGGSPDLASAEEGREAA